MEHAKYTAAGAAYSLAIIKAQISINWLIFDKLAVS